MMQTSWVRQRREELGVSQYKMARALGYTNASLSALELGKRSVEDHEVELLNDFFENHQTYFRKNGISLKKQKFERNFTDTHELKPERKQELVEEFYKRNKWPSLPVDDDLRAVMLFSGIGGMSLGFRKAGYQIVGHVEIEDSANHIYKKNFVDSKCLGTDIKQVSDSDIRALKEEHGEIDVLAGGPPCQGFSLAGKRNVLDPRNELFTEFARFAKVLSPKMILLENVRTLLSMHTKDNVPVVESLIKTFDKAGYELRYQPVNAKDYGVPQSRERVIFIGIRKDLAKDVSIAFPPPVCGQSNPSLFNENVGYKTFRDATDDLEPLESGQYSPKDPWHFAVKHPQHVVEMLRNVPEGKSAHENSNPSLRPSSGYNTTYKRICWNEPSSTISTNFSMISGSRNVHPVNTRSLTIREAMRCQTFPDYFVLDGSLGDIRKGIGNAVPPQLAEVFARHFKSYIKSRSA